MQPDRQSFTGLLIHDRTALFLLAVVLLIGTLLRFQGLDWGTSNYDLHTPSDSSTTHFYHFHPDETSNVKVAGNLKDSWRPNINFYGENVAYSLYGASTVYLNALAVRIADLFVDFEPYVYDNSNNERLTFLAVRILNAMLGALSPLLLFLAARRLYGAWTGLGAAALFAVTMLHVQMSHFGVVDVPVVFFSLAAFYFITCLYYHSRLHYYLLAGAFFGIAVSTKVNAILLVLPFLTAHTLSRFRSEPWNWRRVSGWMHFIRVLLQSKMLAAGGMTILVFFLLNPYAILDFKDYLFADNAFGFFHILRNIRGENLYPFQIQFMDNNFPLAYLFSNLLPWGMGWPLAVLGGAGVVIQIIRGRSADWILLVWLLVTLLLTHNAKVLYIRYALPLIPLLLLGGVRGIALLWEWRPTPTVRYALSLLVLLVWGYGLAWSTAFNSVYKQEDSRLAAARWLGQNVSHGTTVLHEQSANSMKFYLDREDYDLLHLSIHMLYRSGGLLTFQERIDYLYHKLAMADYFIFVDTNRMAGYREVSKHFPVETDFYNLLLSGRLGYELVFDRKMPPEVLGWEIDDTEAEFSLRYYDHSRTFILRKTDSFSRDLFDRWRDLYQSAAGTQDELIRLAQQQIALGEWEQASSLLGQGLNNQQGLITKLRLLGDCALALGDTTVAHQAYENTLQYDRLQPQISYQYYIQFLLDIGKRAEAERAYAGLHQQLAERRAEVKALERFWAEATDYKE